MTFIDTALKLLNLPAHKLSIPFLYFYRNLHQFCPKIVEPTSCTNLAYIFCTFIEIICIDTALKLLNLPASAHKHSMYTFYSIFTEIIWTPFNINIKLQMTWINSALKLRSLPPAYTFLFVFIQFWREKKNIYNFREVSSICEIY